MDQKIFEELLFADVVRGKHATGVAVVKGQCRQVNVHKRALASPLYLELGSTATHLSNFINNTVVLGHNRHATKGNSADPEGAHPFQHGHITLVHNGSLTTHNNLTTENFTVDSEAICRAIELDGIEAVAPKLRGAFALVWINSEDNTLNFLRNGEREFAIAWNSKSNRMWWASEKGMLEWQLNRDTFTRMPVDYDACFNLPEGKWISIPITHTSINIEARTEINLDISNSVYTAPVRSTYNNTAVATKTTLENQATGSPVGNEVVTPLAFGATRELALKKLTSSLVSDKGRTNFMIRAFVSSLDMDADAAVLDERIGVFMTKWEAYSTASLIGALNGQMMEYPYTNVVIHGFSEEEYDELYTKCSGVITSYLSGFVTPLPAAITVKQGGLLSQEDLLQFSLGLRKDQIRKADLSEFYWDIDKMPAEDLKVLEKIEAITPKLKLVELPPEDSPLRVFELSDGTKVSPGGTAIFTGLSTSLHSDLRYNITKIEWSPALTSMLLTAKLGNDTFIYSSKYWRTGTLSKEADTEATPSAVIGPHGEHLTVGKWEVAVAKGCCHCEEVPSGPKEAEGLVWIGTEFYCEMCHFSLANVGY